MDYVAFGDVPVGTYFKFDVRSSHLFVKTSQNCPTPDWRGGLAAYSEHNNNEQYKHFPVGNHEQVIKQERKTHI